jgi:AraC family transcriptional regulator of adaptative response / DNA-3-methyladenine glycosylase II
MIGFLAARAIAGVEVVTPDGYARTIALDGAVGTVAVSRGDGDRLAVTVRFPKLTALPSILSRVRRVFDLTADPETIEAHLSADPDLARMIAARPGLRAPGAWDGLELGVRAILGQQITVPAAVKLAGRLTAEYGEALPAEWAQAGLTHAFPSALRLAAADIASHGLMPGARARAISGLAAAVAADPALFGPRASLGAAIAALRALPGIGEWTAQYIAMRQLREPDAFPAADVGLMRALADADGVRPTPAQLLARAEAWRPWRAYAALHLWASDPQAPAPAKAKAKDKADARVAA